jgi:hypothetical protein
MVRHVAALLALSALCALPARAQHPPAGHPPAGHPPAGHPTGKPHAPAPTAKDADRLTGTWEGTYQAQHNGGMELVVARDSAWKASMQLTADHPFPPLDLRDFTVDGTKVSWGNDLMGTPCKATAVVDGAKMTGQMACGTFSLSFTLAKK